MSLISQALEECKSCHSQQITDSLDNTKSPKQTDMTYNEGDGIKDTVVINGPLSEVVTKALNITLKKQPLEPLENDPPTPQGIADEQADQAAEEQKDPLLRQNQPEKLGIATESQQQDSVIEEFLIREFNSNSQEIDFIANRFDFLDQDQLPVDVTCKTTAITLTDFMKPSIMHELAVDRTNSPVEHVVLVISDALARTSQTTTKREFVTVGASSNPCFESNEQELEFNAAIESHIKPAGYKVVIGVEAYLDYLKQMARNLSYRK